MDERIDVRANCERWEVLAARSMGQQAQTLTLIHSSRFCRDGTLLLERRNFEELLVKQTTSY